jgi:hypothetical protein
MKVCLNPVPTESKFPKSGFDLFKGGADRRLRFAATLL